MRVSNNFPFPYNKGSLPAVALAEEGPGWGYEMICAKCGTNNIDGSNVCRTCGESLRSDEYSPPSSLDLGDDAAGSYGMKPWEMKRCRISGLSWAAVILACIIPPVGLLIGIFASIHANKHKNRPGNKAVAYSSIGAAFHVGLVYVAMFASVWAQTTTLEDSYLYPPPAYVDDDPLIPDQAGQNPWGNPGDMAELERLLKQVQEDADKQQ